MMKFFSFLRAKACDDKEVNRLIELLEKNDNGIKRKNILNELSNHKLVLGTRRKLPGVLDSSMALPFLVSSSPDGEGESLMSFISEDGLAERNKNAFPAWFDLHAVNDYLYSSDLKGLVINYNSGWCYFTKEELIKATANHN